ncbi:MAG: hypothetical protein IPI63_07985 [Methanothrix sp.]|nr:hypothetical protein [Methanothrix sp.]MBK7386659.1 hypothetical protein [Methanothrix sp.]HPW72281.1 hypothetical protein [Methanothrix sp.]
MDEDGRGWQANGALKGQNDYEGGGVSLAAAVILRFYASSQLLFQAA